SRCRPARLRECAAQGRRGGVLRERGEATRARRMDGSQQGQGRLRDQLQPLLLRVHTAKTARADRCGAEDRRGRNPSPAARGDDVTSHLAWTQRVPSGWGVKSLRAVSRYVVSNVDKIPVDGEPAVRLCTYSDVYNNEFITQHLDFMACTATED